jgi:hypothetical protein
VCDSTPRPTPILRALSQICASGAAGNESSAADCYATLRDVTIPGIRAQAALMNETMRAAFPNVDSQTGAVWSGSYYNEQDYLSRDWREDFWGPASNGVYARLRAVKDAYDPNGLFICHQCVGSEDWSDDGNCHLN